MVLERATGALAGYRRSFMEDHRPPLLRAPQVHKKVDASRHAMIIRLP